MSEGGIVGLPAFSARNLGQHDQRGFLLERAKTEVVTIVEASAELVLFEQVIETDGAGKDETAHHPGRETPGAQPTEQTFRFGSVPRDELFQKNREFVDQDQQGRFR